MGVKLQFFFLQSWKKGDFYIKLSGYKPRQWKMFRFFNQSPQIINARTVSQSKLHRESETTLPDREKMISQGTDVAGIDKTSVAMRDKIGKLKVWDIHHGRSLEAWSSSLHGSLRYRRISSLIPKSGFCAWRLSLKASRKFPFLATEPELAPPPPPPTLAPDGVPDVIYWPTVVLLKGKNSNLGCLCPFVCSSNQSPNTFE